MKMVVIYVIAWKQDNQKSYGERAASNFLTYHFHTYKYYFRFNKWFSFLIGGFGSFWFFIIFY